MLRIIQQRKKCIGCNAYAEAAKYRWRMSRKDGKSTLIGGVDKKGFLNVVIDDDELEENLKAAKNCPVNIIRIERIK